MSGNDEEPTRRSVLARSLALAAATGAQPLAAAPPLAPSRSVNVRDFGAVGDGKTDDTEAFNRATRADADWSWDMLYAVHVPAGRYRIAGTVYLRKGQSLIGEGLSTYIDASQAKRSTFVMGRRRDGKRGVEDPGGLPVRIERLMGLGGAPDQGFIYAAIPGFQINGLFLSAVGLGIEIEAADGIISDIAIDQCLTGVMLSKSQNIIVSNLNVYLANYGVTLAGNCRDIIITNSIFCYSKYAALLLGDGAVGITSLNVANCIFTNNVPYETFEGFIYSRASQSDMLVTGCIFRNAPNYAVNQGAGIGLSMTLHGCIFDGLRTNPDYNQSLASKGVRTGYGRFSLTNCSFRNLAADAIRIAPGLESLVVEGGSIENVKGQAIAVEADPGGPVVIRNVQGLGQITTSGSEHLVALPLLGLRGQWHLTVSSRDAGAPTRAAQFIILAGQNEPITQTLWSVGKASTISVTPDMSARATAGRLLRIRLDGRQFGTVTPSIEVVGHA